jgi:hypothetical protein
MLAVHALLVISAYSANTESRPVRALCPPPAFDASLQLIREHLPNGSLERIGGAASVRAHYLRTSADAVCQVEASDWPPSQRKRGLLINAGEGTTGTRWLNCAMRHLGAKTGHDLGAVVKRFTTKVCDNYDFVSDSPVPYILSTLFSKHPDDLTAGVMLTVRDPLDYQRSRLGHHRTEAKHWGVGTAGCMFPNRSTLGAKGFALAREKVRYDVLAACMATKFFGPGKLLIFNVFTDPRSEYFPRLARFLQHHAPFLQRKDTVVALQVADTACRDRVHHPPSLQSPEAKRWQAVQKARAAGLPQPKPPPGVKHGVKTSWSKKPAAAPKEKPSE